MALARHTATPAVATFIALAIGAGAGAAHATPPRPAANSFADRAVTKVTDDGWRVTATKSHEHVRSVPPLNQSPWTREGFLSLKAAGGIAGAGSSPVTAGTVTGGFQVGCNTDVSSGATIGIAGGPNATLNISYPPALGVGASVQPSISSTLKPGTITDIPLGTKKLAAARGAITTDGIHIRVDGCLGPVTLRSYVTVAISTPANDNTINVYGRPHHL
ncbi:MspA family porin [Williamsia maris]|uniref:MspA protein n=1 Tax=Williamsia maris TaxID=72806 RepID=A0ABT1HJF5_9NOCA|nr:MspA family porin [Williamsia maris]MCP2178057.1 MspA protein [Williamsia maris]